MIGNCQNCENYKGGGYTVYVIIYAYENVTEKHEIHTVLTHFLKTIFTTETCFLICRLLHPVK